MSDILQLYTNACNAVDEIPSIWEELRCLAPPGSDVPTDADIFNVELNGPKLLRFCSLRLAAWIGDPLGAPVCILSALVWLVHFHLQLVIRLAYYQLCLT